MKREKETDREGERHQEQQRQRWQRQQQRATIEIVVRPVHPATGASLPEHVTAGKRSPSCISTSASETSPKTCSDSLRKHLNNLQPIIELGFHSFAVEGGPNQCATVLRGHPLEVEACGRSVLSGFRVQFMLSLAILSSLCRSSAHLNRGWSGA